MDDESGATVGVLGTVVGVALGGSTHGSLLVLVVLVMDAQRQHRITGGDEVALEVLGDKWTPFLIARLVDAPRTFLELEELLPGISPRTLSQRLKKLEEEHILTKVLYEKRPERYRYSLTKKGTELTALLEQMAIWGEKYRM